MVADLVMFDADPRGDQDALHRMALWALKHYSPIVAVDGQDGIVIDSEGADHLRGGEMMMATEIANRLFHAGLSTRVAVADTWGAAHAIARFGKPETTVVPRGDTAALDRLPLTATRLPLDLVASFRTLGIDTVGELAAMPRANIALRFGPEPGRRLDQMFGRVSEPIQPIRPADAVEVHKSFAEPIGAPETIARYIGKLVEKLHGDMEQTGLGVRRADLIAHRVDGTMQAICAGTAKPVRDVKRITRLLCDQIERLDPGFGIEKLSITATALEPIEEHQTASSLIEETVTDISPLVDVLVNRGQRVFRTIPVASDVPERSFDRIGALSPETGASWPRKWPRPPRLLERPAPIEVVALLPDHPPAVFTWQGKRRKVKCADGPERIFGEWWTRNAEYAAVRDYFLLESTDGERFWVFRAGDGLDPDTGSHRWFLHGLFA